jgi:hypothetical protein
MIGDTVTLYEGGTFVGAGPVAGDSTWDIATSPLADGSHTLTATESDIAGDVSPASGPLTLTIAASDSGTALDNITNVTTPRITGTGVAGETDTAIPAAPAALTLAPWWAAATATCWRAVPAATPW